MPRTKLQHMNGSRKNREDYKAAKTRVLQSNIWTSMFKYIYALLKTPEHDVFTLNEDQTKGEWLPSTLTSSLMYNDSQGLEGYGVTPKMQAFLAAYMKDNELKSNLFEFDKSSANNELLLVTIYRHPLQPNRIVFSVIKKPLSI